jgi:hypothetical protein
MSKDWFCEAIGDGMLWGLAVADLMAAVYAAWRLLS